MTFPAGMHELIEGELKLLEAEGNEPFGPFRSHFTTHIKVHDLSNYPCVHFVIPELDIDAQRALTREIQQLDKESLC